MNINRDITLVSTAVVPAFRSGTLTVTAIDNIEVLRHMLDGVHTNLHGHAATVEVLRALCPELPEAQRGFWDGNDYALAVRPRGGVRAAGANGDTAVRLEDLEAALIIWSPW